MRQSERSLAVDGERSVPARPSWGAPAPYAPAIPWAPMAWVATTLWVAGILWAAAIPWVGSPQVFLEGAPLKLADGSGGHRPDRAVFCRLWPRWAFEPVFAQHGPKLGHLPATLDQGSVAFGQIWVLMVNTAQAT